MYNANKKYDKKACFLTYQKIADNSEKMSNLQPLIKINLFRN